MKVLFVGNSYTLYGDVPGQVAALAAADPEGPAIETDRVAQGGATLKLHATPSPGSGTGAWDRVADPEWTHVVLQEKSTGTLHDAPDYHRYVRALGERVRGEVLLYETWARRPGHEVYRWGWSGKRPSTMRRRVRAELELAARDLRARIVPVGTAWERCMERYPDLDLYDADGHHASAIGSHLAACTFYAFLSGRDAAQSDFLPPGVDADAARRVRAAVASVV
ncbi:MAG: hypothetical protein H6719_22930 [Sandaracinaceae bacterium]|nr:hypothetical protein [Sandaracinaceae bacterium]